MRPKQATRNESRNDTQEDEQGEYLTQFLAWAKKEKYYCHERLYRSLASGKVSPSFVETQMRHWDFVVELGERLLGGTFEQTIDR